MVFSIFFTIVQLCTAQIHETESPSPQHLQPMPTIVDKQWTIPIASDEHGILCFGNPFDQNETTQEQSPTDKPQLMDESSLLANFDRELYVELSPLHELQPQAIKTQLMNENIESLSPNLSQPVYEFMRLDEIHQNIANPEGQQQKVPSILSQETLMSGMDMELTDADLGTLLAYGDLGHLSVDDISCLEALTFDTDTESCLNATYSVEKALMRDAKHQPNASDSTAQLLTPATFSDPTNVRDVGEKRDGNTICPTSSGSVCGHSFGSVRSNSGHSFVQSNHFKHSFVNQTGQKPFQCDMCPKQFSTSSSCRRHRQTHTGEKKFQCDMCPKQFITSSDYHRHRRTHTGEKSFQCDMCPKQFSSSGNYQKHRRIHAGKKPFECDMCPKQFSCSSNYQRHRRTHTGEKPFQCDMCLKQFIASSDYHKHRRTHTGEKPFSCDICAKQFRTSSDCRTHQRTHTGEKPFKCDFCEKEFSDRSNYQAHRRRHTSEKILLSHTSL